MISMIAESLGDGYTLALAGLVVGLIFGASAEQSKFCLRAAAVEIGRFHLGPRFSVWLLTFSTGLLWTQIMHATGMIDLGESRWLASPGTMSGAIIGGLVFGAGMILSKGCPGRLLVLGATGNMRSILSGLVFAVVAQMSLYGLFAPIRNAASNISITAGPNPHILSEAGLPDWAGIAIGIACAALALWVSWRNRVSFRVLMFGSGVGFAVAMGWYLTYAASMVSFDPVSIGSLTFSGPSAETLMFVLTQDAPLGFDVGLVPGVFLAAFASAAISGRLQWQGFDGVGAMGRYLTGAALMGFGAMTAGGCTIGAGVTGGSTFALTAWIALISIWFGGMITDAILRSGIIHSEASPSTA